MAIHFVRACKTGITFTKKYSYNTYDFYKRFFSGTCTKRERKKAKKNMKWYRNGVIVSAALYGVKWKIDVTKQEFKQFALKEFPNMLEKQIRHPNPPPAWKRVFCAIEDKVHEKGPQIKAAVKREVKQEIMQAGKNTANQVVGGLEQIGRWGYAWFEPLVRKIL